jgi:hypothetical protein
MNKNRYITTDEMKAFRKLKAEHIFHIVRVCDTSKAYVMSVLQANTNITDPTGKQVYDTAKTLLTTIE